MIPSDWTEQVAVQNQDLAWRMVDDECIIIDPQGSQATVLNPVGARIWELLDGKRSAGSIVEQILTEYDADRARIRADAEEFLADLLKRGLIRFENSPGA